MTMLHSKDYYRAIAPQGWEWVGAGDLPYTHIFSRRVPGAYKFEVLECSENCLHNGDLKFLAEKGMTCNRERLRGLSRDSARDIKKAVKALQWHILLAAQCQDAREYLARARAADPAQSFTPKEAQDWFSTHYWRSHDVEKDVAAFVDDARAGRFQNMIDKVKKRA